MEMLKNWEVAVDGIQIFLCLLILFILIRNHRRKLKPELMHSKPVSGQNFNMEVFSQTNRFILNAGCAIPSNTPEKNIHRMIQVSRDFNR